MIIFFLQVILFTYLISSTFTFTHVVDTNYAEKEADHARNTSLAVGILAGTALAVINIAYYFNLIGNYRMTIILIFVNFMTAILSLIVYVYLQKQRESPPDYAVKLKELSDAAETRNVEAQKFSYWTGLVNIVILGLIVAYLLGHTQLTEHEFVRIREPKLYNTPRGRTRAWSPQGRIFERINKNFIV